VFLQLTESSPESYDVLFKVPARGDKKLRLEARLPEHCAVEVPVRRDSDGAAFREVWTVNCPGGLEQGSVAVAGLEGTLTDVLVRIQRADGSTRIERLSPDAPSLDLSDGASTSGVLVYLSLGVQHILGGVDHLLFVLALLLVVEGRRRLVATVTAFTVAHSFTLAAATLGFVRVPSAPVEAVIALSIVFVATEIVHGRQGRPGLTARRPWLVALTFGLLHGFGFAGALAEVGLPEASIPLALLFFNLGVETGQLLFIAAALSLMALGRHVGIAWPAWSWRVPAYTIGGVAAFWTVERVASFWA
jgi:hypothetical protein